MAIPVRSLRLLPQSQDRLNNLTGSRGEIFYDRDANNIRIFDGTSTGGRLVGRTEEQIQDLVATMFAGSSSNVSVAYDDPTGKIVLTANIPVPEEFSGDYNDLINTPTLAAVATSGSYDDLTGKPVITGFSGDYQDLINQPDLFSGNYDDLINKPTLAAVATSGSYNDLSSRPTLFSGSYADLTGVPNLLSSPTLTGTTTLQQSTEVLNTKTGATGTVEHDFATGAIWYHTSIATNFTANFTNVPTTNNRTINVVLILVQGATARLPIDVSINGATQTINWLTLPTGSANKIDLVSFTLIRTGSAWTVLGSLSTYG
jgi:hypothetical protein